MSPSSICLAILYVIMSGVALFSAFAPSRRRKRLLLPLAVNLGAAILVLFLGAAHPSNLLSIDPFGVSRQELFITLLLALIFALSVEIPGFALNLTYDKKVEEALQNIGNILLDVRFSPTDGNRTRLRDSAVANREILAEGRLGNFLVKCAAELAQLGNADPGLLNLLIERVHREQSNVSDRSKHPFPVLIQVLSLSGVGFVLAEMLAILRTR